MGQLIDPRENRREREFLFDVKLFATIHVTAAHEPSARRMLARALDCASVNAGAWPNGDPIQFEVSQDSEADLLEVIQDGEACS